MKYKLLTTNTKRVGDTILYQIQATVDIPSIGVHAGDLGGYIQSEYNLSQGRIH